jgi:hypothetical protein
LKRRAWRRPRRPDGEALPEPFATPCAFPKEACVELTPAQKDSINQWNALGGQITEAAMRHFLDSWFHNIRSLLKANFTLHSVEELTSRLGHDYETITVLGSGPSISEIARRLPAPHGAILCGPTALGALTREGIRPTTVVVADSNPEMYCHIVETKLSRPRTLDVVLPVTADPSWYAEDSILNRSRLYFYLPYLDFMGDTDIGFNHILKQLFPEVQRWIGQAGSVGNLAMNIADMSCGESAEKRIYVGLDCSWIKGRSVRAPLRFDLARHSPMLQHFWDASLHHIENNPIIELPFRNDVVQTDLLQIGYAINLFYLMHSWMRRPYSKDRYALISYASSLYFALPPKLEIPVVAPEQTAGKHTPVCEETWAYKTLLSLVELSNKLHNRLKEEENAVKNKAVES